MLELFNLKPLAFGLDISNSSLKIVRLKKKGKSFNLASFYETEIPPGAIEEGEIKNKTTLSETIKESLRKVKGEKLRTNYVIASLPEEKAFLQVIQMPIMEEEELKKAVHFEAENYIPLPIKDVYLDFQIFIPLHDHLDHLDVLIAALPKKTIDAYAFVLKEAGLIPKVLEIESQAIARALIKNEVSASPVLLINLGETRANFVIFSGHSLRFASSIPVPCRKCTEIIAKILEVNLTEAEELKMKYGLKEKYQLKIKDGVEREIEGGKIFEAMLPLLNDLIGQIRTHLSYYQSHASHEHLNSEEKGVEKILLCGKEAGVKGLTDFLSAELKIPVEIANPWVNVLTEPLREIPELSFEKSLTFVTAIGLALRGIKDK